MKHIPLSEFIDRLSKIMLVIVREFVRRQSKDLSKEELTFSQFVVLNLLNSQQKMKMKELANSLDVTTANMTGMIERLIRQKLVQRLFDPKDRRVIYVALTDKGKSLIEKIERDRRRVLMEVFSGLSEFERQQYLKILSRIKDIILEKK